MNPRVLCLGQPAPKEQQPISGHRFSRMLVRFVDVRGVTSLRDQVRSAAKQSHARED